MIKHYASLAILMAALTVAVSCNKEKRYKGPSTLPTEKVSRVYRTTHQLIESYNSITDTWKTNADKTGERELNKEFFWEGDRLTRAKLYGHYYTFSYDDVGRLILATNEDGEGTRYEYSYNDDGLLSRAVIRSYGFDEYYDYTWANGQMQKYEVPRIVTPKMLTEPPRSAVTTTSTPLPAAASRPSPKPSYPKTP